MAHKFTGSVPIIRPSNDGFCFAKSTLHEYEINEISVGRAAKLLKESKRLRANALADRDVGLGNKLAASRVAEWNSLCCLGYEVEEIDLECVETWRDGEIVTKQEDGQTDYLA